MDDTDIIRRVQTGDSEAYSFLVEKYHRQLLNFIFRLVGDEKIVEDLGQEVFLSVYASIRQFDLRRGTPFSAWLFMIARNRCVSEIRKRRSRTMVPIEDAPDLRSTQKSAEEMLGDRQRESLLASCLEQLEEPYREAILSSLRGESLEGIAQKQLIPIGTVKSRLFRAREKMKRLLRAHSGSL